MLWFVVLLLYMGAGILAYTQWVWFEQTRKELSEIRSDMFFQDKRFEEISTQLNRIETELDGPTPAEVAIHEQQLAYMAHGSSHHDGEASHRLDPREPG